MSRWKTICQPTGANASVLIRFVVGLVFLNEGILKLLNLLLLPLQKITYRRKTE